MKNPILVIGAGIGGLIAAIRLAQKGFSVKILEARSEPGGLASGFDIDNFNFGAGPYILLDKPGLEWAFSQIGIDINSALTLSRIQHIYKVQQEDGSCIAFDADINATADKLALQYNGAGQSYKNFVDHTYKVYKSLQPLTFKSHPTPIDLVLNGSIRYAPFLLRSLPTVLQKSKLAEPVQQAIAIWTSVAGQSLAEAPSPMAFVPALFHHVGAYYIKGGMQSIAKTLLQKALDCGVEINFNTPVKTIKVNNKSVEGIETLDGTCIPAHTVISNAAGIGTYTELLSSINANKKRKLEALPLQSPGICVYLAVKGVHPPYYIQFKQSERGCIAFVQPGIMEPGLEQNGWFPARLIAPLSHEVAAKLGETGQLELMENLIKDNWWQQGISEYKVLHCRTTFEWGKEYHLYKNSMNPVMTAEFMRKGRLRHRSPYARGLYLTGSSTHPGQWTSFCAVSGVLAAGCVIEDMS